MAKLLALYAFIVAALSFVGWALDIPLYADWDGDGIAMQPNTTVGCAVAALGALLLSPRWFRFAAVAGVFVLLLGLANLFQITTNISIGIDTLLMFDREWGRGGVVAPGRFGTPATISFILLGLALMTLALARRNGDDDVSYREKVAGVSLAWTTLGISSLSLMSFLYGADVLHMIPMVTVIAMQTASCLLALSLSLILKHQDIGLTKLICNDGPAGMLVRRILPSIVLIPIILGLLKIIGQDVGLYDTEFGTTARTIVEIALLMFLLWWTGSTVSRYASESGERGRRLELLTKTAPVSIVHFDIDQRLSLANDVFLSWLGKSHDEVEGKHLVDLIGAEEFQKLEKHINHLLDGGGQLEIEEEIVFPTGSRFIKADLAIIDDESGVASGVVAIIDDVTERRETEIRLRESEERFRMASDAARALVYDTDLTGSRPVIVYGLRRVTGYSSRRGDLSSEWWHSLIHKEDIDGHKKILDDVIPHQHSYRSTYRIRHEDGHWIWVEDTARIIRDEAGEAVQAIGTIVDITAQRLVESELEAKILERTAALTTAYEQLKREIRDRLHSERQRFGLLKRLVSVQEDERGRIARDIHDQLGQRLTALRLKLASLRNLVKENKEIINRVDRLQTISELLDGEVSFLAWELRPAILDDAEFLPALEQYVGEWSRFVEITAEFHKTGLHTTAIDGEIATNLYRITQEALNNVAKYSKASLVNVILEKRGDELILIIEDDGVGFDVAAVIDSAEQRGGFGLFGMRERASLIMGTLQVESLVGKGTTIFVRVPLTSVDESYAEKSYAA